MSRVDGAGGKGTRRVLRWALAGGLCLASLAGAAAQPPRLETGRLEARAERGFARLVFSFAERPRHQVSAQPGVLVVRFERPVDVDVAAARATLGPYVANIRRDPDGTALRMALTRRLRVNTAEAGDQLYVDLLPEPWQGAPPPLPPEAVAEIARRAEEAERRRAEAADRERRRANVGPVEVLASEGPTFSRLEFRWRTRVEPTVQRTGDSVRITFDALGRIEPGALRSRLPRLVDGAEVGESDLRTVVTLRVDPLRDVRTFVEGTSVNVDVIGPERGQAIEARADGSVRPPVAPETVAAPSTLLQGRADERTMSPAPPAEPRRVPVGAAAPAAAEAVQVGAASELRFAFASPVPAAVFLRGAVLWAVFETDGPIDPAPLRAALPRVVAGVERERVGAAEVLRFRLEPSAGIVSASADGALWTVRFGEAGPGAPAPVDLLPQQAADGRMRLLASLPRPGRPVAVVDPAVGDRIVVVPAGPPAAALAKAQRLVDLEVLPSAQGLVLRPLSDGLTVSPGSDGAVIEREGGLSVSAGRATRAGELPAGDAPDQRTGFVDFEGWKLGPVDRFAALRGDLVRRIAEAEEGRARTPARLDLARFYLAHLLGPEALSLLAFAEREDPAVERDPAFRALRGAAAVLAQRPELAERDLGAREFEDSQHVALWRGFAAAERGAWPQARALLRRAQPALGAYPRAMQARALRLLVQSALEAGDGGQAEAMLEEAEALDPSPRAQGRVALLRGRAAEGAGRSEAALDFYLAAQAAPDGEAAAEAGFRRVQLALRQARVDVPEAIAALDRVAYGWRGGATEVQAYRLAANLRVSRGAHREGFATMRAAVAAAPDSDVTRALQDEMREAFATVFLGRQEARSEPLAQAALFYDFRELTPSGRRGDELIRALARRLADIDLLDQAAELLAYQVDNRLQGAARAEIAAELAMVQLMNREPDKALAVLRRTRQASLPGALERRRALIEARALAALGRVELAVELLDEQAGEDARRLRADVFWEARRWPEAAESLEGLIGESWRRAPLGERVRADVLRTAVAYGLAADQNGLDRLRTRYAALLADTPEASAFTVLTGRIEAQGTAFRDLVRSIGQADQLAAFLRDMRARPLAPAADAAPPIRAASNG